MKKHLDGKMRTVWLIRSTIIWAIIVLCYLFTFFIPCEYWLYTVLPVGVVLALGVIITYVFVILSYNCYYYYLEEEVVYIEKGVIFKHRMIIPCKKTQDVHLSSGPIMRVLGLKSVEISTAGSNFVVAGLSDAEASKFIADIKQVVGDNSD